METLENTAQGTPSWVIVVDGKGVVGKFPTARDAVFHAYNTLGIGQEAPHWKILPMNPPLPMQNETEHKCNCGLHL